MAPRPDAGGGLVWLTAKNALARVEAAGRVVHAPPRGKVKCKDLRASGEGGI
jgi:hypothetical protein